MSDDAKITLTISVDLLLPVPEESLEFFLCDPPLPMTTDCKVGVELIERGGVVHVVDWVVRFVLPKTLS